MCRGKRFYSSRAAIHEGQDRNDAVSCYPPGVENPSGIVNVSVISETHSIFLAHSKVYGRLIAAILVVSEARSMLAAWRDDYNRVRPHSALANRTPGQFRDHRLAFAATSARVKTSAQDSPSWRKEWSQVRGSRQRRSSACCMRRRSDSGRAKVFQRFV
jgi:hypothetical protein